jgi:hypothetical protein
VYRVSLSIYRTRCCDSCAVEGAVWKDDELVLDGSDSEEVVANNDPESRDEVVVGAVELLWKERDLPLFTSEESFL